VRPLAPFALLALAGVLGGCLGHGTLRVDAPCREMRSAVAWEMLKDNPSIPIFDVRQPSDVTQREGRLEHAIPISLERLGGRVPEIERYRDTTVLVFGRDADDGRTACQLLSGRGFKYVVFVSDGAEGWYRNGLPSVAPVAHR